MPIYTYRCDSCGVRFERHQSYEDASLTRCPECKKKSLKKVIAPVGVVFKGSGFYSTDHKASSAGGPSQPKKKEEAKDGKAAPAPKETKPSESSDSKE